MAGSKEEARVRIEKIIAAAGAESFAVKIGYSGGKFSVRCIVDYPDGGITLEDCAAINRKIFSYLKTGNILGDDYTIEVNSPGLDRPLKTAKDFSKVKGRSVCLWLNSPLEDKAYFEGELAKVGAATLGLRYKDGIIEIAYEAIKFGKEKINFRPVRVQKG